MPSIPFRIRLRHDRARVYRGVRYEVRCNGVNVLSVA